MKKKHTNVISIEAERRKKRRRLKVRRAFTVTFVLLILVVIVTNWNTLSPVAILQRIQTSVENKGTLTQYPLNVSQNTPLQLSQLGDSGILLTNSAYYILGNNAANAYTAAIQNPVASVAGNIGAIFSVGGNDFTLQTSAGKLYTGHSDDPINMISPSKNGSYAMLTEISDLSSRISVYSQTHELLFKQDFTGSRVSTVALSPDGSLVAAGQEDTKGGVLSSTVYIYSLSKEKPLYTLDLGDNLILKLIFNDYGGITAVCDRSVFFFNSRYKQTDKFDYKGTFAGCCVDATGNLAIMTDSGSKTTGKTIQLFSNAKAVYSTDVPYNAQYLSTYNKKSMYYSEGSVHIIDARGNPAGALTCSSEAKGACLTGKNIFVLDKDNLMKYQITDAK